MSGNILAPVYVLAGAFSYAEQSSIIIELRKVVADALQGRRVHLGCVHLGKDDSLMNPFDRQFLRIHFLD